MIATSEREIEREIEGAPARCKQQQQQQRVEHASKRIRVPAYPTHEFLDESEQKLMLTDAHEFFVVIQAV